MRAWITPTTRAFGYSWRVKFPINRHLAGLATLLVVLQPVLPAQAAVDRAALADYAARIEYAVFVEDVDQLVEIATTLAAERPRGGVDGWLSYYTGLAWYRAAQLAGEDYAGEYVDNCDDRTRAAVRELEDVTEPLILRGACSALLAKLKPIAAVLAPSRAIRSFAKARTLQPDNPRLLLAEAIAARGRRTIADEFPEPAELVRLAIEQFNALEDADRLTPDWGEAEAHYLAAEIAFERGDRQSARDAIETALQIAPRYEAAARLLRKMRERG